MAKRKRVLYKFTDLFRQDKLDDYIFAYFTGIRSVIETAKLTIMAENFQKDFKLSEDDCAIEIIIASYHRSLAKYQKYITIDND